MSVDHQLIAQCIAEVKRKHEEEVAACHLLRVGRSQNIKLLVEGVSGQKFLYRYAAWDETFFRILQEIRHWQHIPVILPRNCYRSELGYLCYYSPWVEGHSLDFQQLNGDENALLHAASLTADALRQFHQKERVSPVERTDTHRDALDYALAYWKDLALPHPQGEEFISYVKAHLQDKRLSPIGWTHFDLNSENLIAGEDSVYLSDLELMRWDYVWRDFVYAVCINYGDEREFWLLTLLAYFSYDIPAGFFREVKLYSILYFLMLAKSNQRNGMWSEYCQLGELLYESYDGLRADIPAHLLQTAAELGLSQSIK